MTNHVNTIEAERHVLSAMLESVDAVWEAITVMRLTDMSEPRHETIARSILTVAERDNLAGPIAVIDELERIGELNRSGGPAYLLSLNGYTPTAKNVAFYAQIVHDDARRRRVAAATQTLIAAVADKARPVDEAIDAAREAIDQALADTVVLNEPDPVAEMLAAIDGIGEPHTTFPTRWPLLNKYIRGLQPGRLYVIGARPSVGKSAVALQMATDLARHGTVGFFSLEMGADEVRLRQISQERGISSTLLTGEHRLAEVWDLKAREYALESPQLFVDDRAVLTIADIRAQLRTWVRKHQVSGIVVDYLQLMTGDMSAGKVQMVTEISRQLKIIAKEFKIVVVALSQLNRSSETRSDKTPLLSDLRESGAIEQDADVVLLLHRDVIIDVDNMDVIIAKNRSGQTGMLQRLEWQGEFVRLVG